VPLDVLGWVAVYALLYLAATLGAGLAIFRARDLQ
jgi:hypothetical protein